MNDATERLLDVLEKEFDEYEALGKVLLREREILRSPKLGSMEEQLGMKAHIVTRIHRLEQERERLMKAISAEQGLDENESKLLDLVRSAPAPLAARLMDVRARLQEKTEKVNKVNEGNSQLIDSLLLVVNGVMDSVRSAFAEPTLYGVEGKIGKGRVNGGEILSQAI